MRKSARLAAAKAKKNEEDYMSLLPEEILVLILSYLSLKQAGITSSVSQKWKYLWTYRHELKFIDDYALNRIAAYPYTRSYERPIFINWVNSVVRQHRGVKVDVFKIYFDLDNNSKSAIDNWVIFALAKSVKTLELEFLEYGESLRLSNHNYTFLNLNSDFGEMQVAISSGLKNLRTLTLRCVNVDDEALLCFLSCCPDLRYISIYGSGDLRNVRVTGFVLVLKCLEIAHCSGIESVEISSVNLAAFRYVGSAIRLIISNAPMLNEVAIGEGHSGLENNVFGQLSCRLHHLKALTLEIPRPGVNMTVYGAVPVLPNVQELVLRVGAWDDDCLLELTTLINACPRLNKFMMQLIWKTPTRRRRILREAACESPLEFLKSVEIMGYYGRISDAEIAMYFMQNAIGLENIIISPRCQILNRSRAGVFKTENVARKFARKQLVSKTPPGVNLVIL